MNSKPTIKFSYFTILVLTIIFSLSRCTLSNKGQNQIPSLPDLTGLPPSLNEQLSNAYTRATDKQNAENIGNLGMTFHSSAYYDQAKLCYTLASEKDPSNWIWKYYLGYLNQEMGDSKGAIDNFSAVIKLNPDALQAWYYLGEAYQNLSMTKEAEEAFQKIAFLNTTSSREKTIRVTYIPLPISARFELARIYLSTKRLDEAEKLLTEIIQKNHTISSIYRLLGNVYQAKGNLVLSKKYIVRASDLAEVTSFNDTVVDRLALMSRSDLYLPKHIDDAVRTSNPEWAFQLINQALKYLPDNKYLLSKSIKALLRMNKGKVALPYLSKNLEFFKDDYKELTAVAELLFLKGFYQEVIPYYAQAIKLKPENTDIYENFALSFWKTNNKDSATKLMNDLYEKNKSNPDVLVIGIDYYLKTGDKEKARLFLDRLKQLTPSNSKVYKFSGWLADLGGNRGAAVDLYKSAFQADPTDMEVTQKLGFILIDERKWEQAITLLRKSLEYHPNESIFLERLGTLLISCPDPKLQNIQQGLELSERAFFHIEGNMSTLLGAGKNLALGNAMLGDFQNAAYYMRVTINIAKSENVPQDYMNALLTLEEQIKTAGK